MAVNPLALSKQLTHHQRVTRLYRKSLKHLLSWTMNREAWREQAVLLREKFDENKSLTDKFQIEKVVKDAEAQFELWRHPAPYIHPKAPGGSKYERNVPPPPNALEMLPMEEEWYKEMMDWADGKN
eukprot:TCONS_00062182-protein